MIPLLSTEAEENGHSSVNISNDSSAYDATKQVIFLPDSLLSFHSNSNNIANFSVHPNLKRSDVSTAVTNVLTLLKCNEKI
jgi:hypothetical protein